MVGQEYIKVLVMNGPGELEPYTERLMTKEEFLKREKEMLSIW
ncbi:MAG TPA: hypothetical protein VIK78_19810 [Ruminiclostridium sp.]